MDFFKLNLFSLFTVHFTPVVTYFDENRPQFFGAAGRNWTEILAGRQPTGGLARASICWRVKNHITRPYSSLSTLPNIARFIHISNCKLKMWSACYMAQNGLLGVFKIFSRNQRYRAHLIITTSNLPPSSSPSSPPSPSSSLPTSSVSSLHNGPGGRMSDRPKVVLVC